MAGHERAAEVMTRHVFQHDVQWRARVDDVRIGYVRVADEELIFGRKTERGVERPLQVPVRQHTDQGSSSHHREMPDLMLNHQPACAPQAVININPVREGRHD